MTEKEWKDGAHGFNYLWNLPLCTGDLDGKRVFRSQPIQGLCILIKRQFSIILMALVDSDYKFLYIDVRTNGRGRDPSLE